MAGFMDKIKGMFGGAKGTLGNAGRGGVDQLKDTAAEVKDRVDDLVDQHSDKIPDSVEKTYDKVSEAAEKVIPGDSTDPKAAPPAP